MEINKFSASTETTAKVTPVIKPTNEIAKIMSNEFLKIIELKEYCNLVETDVKKSCRKVQELTSAKNESEKVISEYKTRNKVNAINSESLLRALNELYKYKSELKSSYFAAEKALKAKKLKYKKSITFYESSWQRALKEYEANPVFKELLKIEQENVELEMEIVKLKNLRRNTQAQFEELKENIEKTFLESVLEFSKAVLQHQKVSKSTKQNEKIEPLKIHSEKFKLFKPERDCSPSLDANNDSIHTCSIDVSVFDDITIPTENLESQNLEEEGYYFLQNDSGQQLDNSKVVLEYVNNCQQTPQQKTFTKLNDNEEQSAPKLANENESQYFRALSSTQMPNEQCSRKENANIQDNNDKLQSVDQDVGTHQEESEEEASKDVLMECDESLTDGSYEKQKAENDEQHFQKSSSISSEDLPVIQENANESEEPSKKIREQNNSFNTKPDSGQNDFKSFPGFFTIGNDQDTSKPSIFKLF